MRRVLIGALATGAVFMGGRASCFLTHRAETPCIDAVYAAQLREQGNSLERQVLDHEKRMHSLFIEAAEMRATCERERAF